MIVCGGFGRLHLFQCVDYEDLKIKILESASTNLGLTVKVLSTPITLEDFQSQRLGKYRFVKNTLYRATLWYPVNRTNYGTSIRSL